MNTLINFMEKLYITLQFTALIGAVVFLTYLTVSRIVRRPKSTKTKPSTSNKINTYYGGVNPND